ncbi:MAG: cell division protein ZapD [Salinisphaeraceae bacterium]|nr:cell division protein ZapD [Salinisphaeraceae bacterium]
MPELAFVCYEQPLSERYRSFLRLENLFAQLEYHIQHPQPWSRRAALMSLLDLLNVFSQYDLRGEFTKELQTHRGGLERLRGHESIDEARLEGLLAEFDDTIESVRRVPSRFAHNLLRNNEMLAALNNRAAIQGGGFGFDVPSAQYWLSRPDEAQQHDINLWLAPIDGIDAAIKLLLGTLRDGTEPQPAHAAGGTLVQKTEPGTQLIRVLIPADLPVYPEISSGKHRSVIRFLEQTGNDLQTEPTPQDIDFMLACCRL